MATKWNDQKHKASPEKREQLKREAVAELDTMEGSGMSILRTILAPDQVAVAEQMNISQSRTLQERGVRLRLGGCLSRLSGKC